MKHRKPYNLHMLTNVNIKYLKNNDKHKKIRIWILRIMLIVGVAFIQSVILFICNMIHRTNPTLSNGILNIVNVIFGNIFIIIFELILTIFIDLMLHKENTNMSLLSKIFGPLLFYIITIAVDVSIVSGSITTMKESWEIAENNEKPQPTSDTPNNPDVVIKSNELLLELYDITTPIFINKKAEIDYVTKSLKYTLSEIDLKNGIDDKQLLNSLYSEFTASADEYYVSSLNDYEENKLELQRNGCTNDSNTCESLREITIRWVENLQECIARRLFANENLVISENLRLIGVHYFELSDALTILGEDEEAKENSLKSVSFTAMALIASISESDRFRNKLKCINQLSQSCYTRVFKNIYSSQEERETISLIIEAYTSIS